MKYEVKFVRHIDLTDVETIINLQAQDWLGFQLSPYYTMMGSVYKYEEVETDSITTYIDAFNTLFVGENISIEGYEVIPEKKNAVNNTFNILVELGVTER